MVNQNEIQEELKSIDAGDGQQRGDDFYRQVLIELSALQKLVNLDDEVLVALKRIEGYEDVDPSIVAEDALISQEEWPEWRVVNLSAE